MKSSAVALTAFCAACAPSFAVAAADELAGAAPARAISKSIRIEPPHEAAAISAREAPFVTALPLRHELDIASIPATEEPRAHSASSCDGDRVFCYDPGSGRVIYKPARALMPDIPGLQRENISFRRDRVVFRYSFK
jgi:hypothetical protein